MEFDKLPPVGPVAQAVAKGANLSALFQALALGASPLETIEGLLVAAETAIIVQTAIGVLDIESADGLRAKIAQWGRAVVEQMEKDGSAEEIRKRHEEAMEEYQKAREDNGNDLN